jgi:hypothetical protein
MNEIYLFIKKEKYQIYIKEFLCHSKLNKNSGRSKKIFSLSFVFFAICNLKQIGEKIKKIMLFIFWNEKYFLFEIDFYSIDSYLFNNKHFIPV